jgi:hypothetical protein
MTVTVDASEVMQKYKLAFARLKSLQGFDHRKILRAEAGVIIKTWAGRTKVTTEEKAERRMRSGVAWSLGMQSAGKGNIYGVTVNDASRGGHLGMVWYRTPQKKFQNVGVIYSGGYFSQSNLHYKSEAWEGILEGVTAYTRLMLQRRPMVMKSLGLSRQSVLQIADSLGIDLLAVKGGGTLSAAGVAKARAAIASNGSSYQNGTGQEEGNAIKYHVDLINRLPYNTKIGMDAVLLGVISGRAGYILRSYEKGAFDSMKNTAKAFPEIIRVAGMDTASGDSEAVD